MKNFIVRPVITEKTLILAGGGWYTFMVLLDAGKKDIAREISALYKVTVMDVRVMRMHGKVRRAGKRTKPVKKPDWKKALVRLVKGQKIDAFEVTGAPKEKV